MEFKCKRKRQPRAAFVFWFSCRCECCIYQRVHFVNTYVQLCTQNLGLNTVNLCDVTTDRGLTFDFELVDVCILHIYYHRQFDNTKIHFSLLEHHTYDMWLR
jgi:hypothetical protein